MTVKIFDQVAFGFGFDSTFIGPIAQQVLLELKISLNLLIVS